MKLNLKILFVEDVPSDYELIKREIKKSGIEFVDQLVETREAYKDALLLFKPDIILSDYSLPQFDGMQALKIRQKETPNIPFILVTGALNEETAVNVMKAGSDDYVLKQNLMRLGSAIESAINKWNVIKAKKQAEEALKKSEELLKRTNEIAKIGGWEIELPSMKTFLTEHTFHIYEIDPSELTPTIEAGIKYYAPEARPIIKAAVKAAVEDGTPYELELPFITAKGRNIWIHTKCEPIFENGKITKLTGTFQDITESKQAEEKIAQLSQAVEQSPASIVITNLKGEIEYTNPKFSEITGYLPGEALGKNPRILKSKESSSNNYKKLWSTIKSGNEWRGEFHNQKKNGELYWEFASISSIKNMEGKITHYLAVKEDITERKHAEEQLRESEAKYRKLIETTSEGFWLINDMNETIDVNQSLCTMLGYFRDEIIGKTPFGFVRNTSQEVFKKQINGSKISIHRNYEIELIKKDGDSFPAIFNATTLLDDTGERIGGFAFITDISERKKSEELVKSSEERLKILFESAPDAYYLTDLKGTFIDGNKAAEELVGYKREELIGQSFLKLKILPEKDILKASENLYLSALGKGTGPEEFTLIHRDGRQISTEIRTYPVKIESRTVILGIARDITERKLIDESLKESEAKYRSLIEHSNDAIYLLNNRKFELVNNQFLKMFGYTREEINKREIDFMQFVAPKSRNLLEDRQKQIANGDKLSSKYEFTAITKNGKEIEVETSVSVIEFNEGKATQGIIRDITERKKRQKILMNAILKVQEEEKNKFGKELHDGLGQVLTSASMYIESIRKIKDELPEDKKKDLEMAHILNKQAIGDARKISHGLMITGINENGLKHLIEQICKNTSKPEHLILYEYKNVDEGKINSETKIHLYRIVQELVVNILKHSSASEAKIRLSISPANKLKLVVSDNGIGFDLKNIKYGAGLHNVMYRNTILNGKIDISSTGGKGTKVTIIVPLIQ